MKSQATVLMGMVLSVGCGLVASARLAAQTAVTATAAGRSTAPAYAILSDAQSRQIGKAHLLETPHGVLLRLVLQTAPPGVHALHLHEVGRCDGPTFESAGAHVGLSGRQHGFLEDRGPHAGDLPNIEVPGNGQLTVEYLVKDVTLDSGAGSLMDGDGSALVMHDGKDDYLSDPAGNSGDRIACGRVVR